jgi:hypothetical protein
MRQVCCCDVSDSSSMPTHNSRHAYSPFTSKHTSLLQVVQVQPAHGNYATGLWQQQLLQQQRQSSYSSPGTCLASAAQTTLSSQDIVGGRFILC